MKPKSIDSLVIDCAHVAEKTAAELATLIERERRCRAVLPVMVVADPSAPCLARCECGWTVQAPAHRVLPELRKHVEVGGGNWWSTGSHFRRHIRAQALEHLVAWQREHPPGLPTP